MKKKFSTKWVGSRQPRKQRKYRANAPLHIKHKMISVNLSKELRKKYGKRNFPLRKGDNVKIMIGEFKKRSGKIELIDVKRLRVAIEGIYRTKKDGTKVNVYFSPSNLQIKELDLEDKKRRESLERTTKEKISNTTEEKTEEIKFKKLPKQEDKKNVPEKK